MTNLKDGRKDKLFEESRKDILWWSYYLERFNGISMIVNEDPIPLTMNSCWMIPMAFVQVMPHQQVVGLGIRMSIAVLLNGSLLYDQGRLSDFGRFL